jgi:hypothetical protein
MDILPDSSRVSATADVRKVRKRAVRECEVDSIFSKRPVRAIWSFPQVIEKN